MVRYWYVWTPIVIVLAAIAVVAARAWARGRLDPSRRGRRRWRTHSPGGARLMNTISTGDVTELSGTDCPETVSELSSRSSYGVDVALLWKQYDNTATIVVVDHCTGEAFQLRVQENDNALHMFHHPYAYAARRRVDRPGRGHGQAPRIAA